MFDIGFWELVLITTVALLVVGPERLPGVARETGKWIGKLKRFIYHARREIERELDLDDQAGLDQRLSELDDLMQHAPDKDPDFSPSAPIGSGKDTESDPSSKTGR